MILLRGSLFYTLYMTFIVQKKGKLKNDMKKRKLLLFLLLISLIIIPILSGCDKKDTESEESEPTPTIAVDNTEPTESPEDLDEEADQWLADYPMQMGESNIKHDPVFEEGFESGESGFTGRGSAQVEVVDSQANEGTYSLYVTGREEVWNGAIVDLSELLEANSRYIITAYVYYDEGPDTVHIDAKLERNSDQYPTFASIYAKKGEWTMMRGAINLPEDTESAALYFETGYDGNDLIDFYVDDIYIAKETSIIERGHIPAIKDVYKDYFTVGVAATVDEITPDRKELISQQFNTLTPGNELKADSVLDYETCISDPKYDDNPAISFKNVEPLLDFAKENNLKTRGHTLIWHSQTPRWFFTEGYSNDPNAPFVSRDLMLKRMENYIKNVFEYVDANYPDLFYAWDVVNEAINPGEGQEGGIRYEENYYYQIIGPDYLEKAFEYARKYADESIKLFYNDYNTEEAVKAVFISELAEKLSQKGLIDGVGLQTHMSTEHPSFVDVEASIRRYAELGLEIQITEIDMGTTINTKEEMEKQAIRYKRFFSIIKRLVDDDVANITNVTFWGLSDDISWLNEPGEPSYPLLFDQYLVQKPAFWGAVLHPDVPLY